MTARKTSKPAAPRVTARMTYAEIGEFVRRNVPHTHIDWEEDDRLCDGSVLLSVDIGYRAFTKNITIQKAWVGGGNYGLEFVMHGSDFDALHGKASEVRYPKYVRSLSPAAVKRAVAWLMSEDAKNNERRN